jgi:mono/diheme cytochrome c family protein
MADILDPRPARHSDGGHMNGLDDAYLFEVIKRGGPAVGKSPQMAGWAGPLDDAQIRDVIAFIRTLADPPYTPPAD